jgi:hypothetical protein
MDGCQRHSEALGISWCSDEPHDLAIDGEFGVVILYLKIARSVQ